MDKLNIILGYTDTEPDDFVETYDFIPQMLTVDDIALNRAVVEQEKKSSLLTTGVKSTEILNQSSIGDSLNSAKKSINRLGLTFVEFLTVLFLIIVIAKLLLKD